MPTRILYEWLDNVFDLYFQAYGELPAISFINRTAIDIAMQDISAEEDFGFDFENHCW